MPNEIEPTKQDLKMVEKFMEETGRAWVPPAEFAAWLRTNWWIDAEHESWYSGGLRGPGAKGRMTT